MSDFFYDGQIRRYVTQFMRIFVGFKTEAGDGTQRTTPVKYGDLTRQVAAIIRENSENKMPTVPMVSCYITGLEMDNSRLTDPTYVSKMNVRERAYEFNDAGQPVYTGAQGASYTVERLMPTPFTLSMKADIWTSNTDQKLQLLEQILVLFNPSLEIQSTDNYIDWTSLSAVYLENMSFSSRSIPQGVDSEIDICSIDFTMPIYITPPAKVKKLGIVQNIIANIFTEQGDVQDIETLVYNTGEAQTQEIIPAVDYSVLLLKSDNGQPYDYNVTLVDRDEIVANLTRLGVEYKIGDDIDWTTVLSITGGYKAGSTMYFKQPTGYEIAGTFAVHPVDPAILTVTFDQDTIPTNTVLSGVESRGTIDAIIDPYKFNPVTQWNGLDNIPTGTRYLMLDDVNNSANVGQTIDISDDASTRAQYDGPDGWKDLNGNDPAIAANSIIEWNGERWTEIFDPDTGTNPTYIQNIRTGVQYIWNGEQWLKSFEGEYAPGYWRFDLNPA